MKIITTLLLSHLAFVVPVFSAATRFESGNRILKREGGHSSPTDDVVSSINSTAPGSGPSSGLPIQWDLKFAGAAFQDRQLYPTIISIYDELAYLPGNTQGSAIVSREDYGIQLRLTKLYDSFQDLSKQDISQAVLALIALSEELANKGKFMECSGVASSFGVQVFNVTIETTPGKKRRDSSYHGLQIRNLDSHTLNTNLTANLVNVTNTAITNENSSMFRLLLSSAFGLMSGIIRDPNQLTTTYQVTTGKTNSFFSVATANKELPKDDPNTTFEAKHVLDALLYLTDWEIEQPFYRFVSALVSFSGTPEFYIELKGIWEYKPEPFSPLPKDKRAISG